MIDEDKLKEYKKIVEPHELKINENGLFESVEIKILEDRKRFGVMRILFDREISDCKFDLIEFTIKKMLFDFENHVRKHDGDLITIVKEQPKSCGECDFYHEHGYQAHNETGSEPHCRLGYMTGDLRGLSYRTGRYRRCRLDSIVIKERKED
jgi:hypothetical protein